MLKIKKNIFCSTNGRNGDVTHLILLVLDTLYQKAGNVYLHGVNDLQG